MRTIGSNRLFFEILVLISLPARVIDLNYLFFKVLVLTSLPIIIIDLNRLFFKVVVLPLALGYILFYILSTIGIRSYSRKGLPS